jgi:hypothetical protein
MLTDTTTIYVTSSAFAICDVTLLYFSPFLHDGTSPLKGWNCPISVYIPLLVRFHFACNSTHAHPIQSPSERRPHASPLVSVLYRTYLRHTPDLPARSLSFFFHPAVNHGYRRRTAAPAARTVTNFSAASSITTTKRAVTCIPHRAHHGPVVIEWPWNTRKTNTATSC